ncbi:hypothetical protein [Streptomyces prasinus]
MSVSPACPAGRIVRRRARYAAGRLRWHPYWGSVPSVPAARSELRQMVRARGAVQAA